MKDKIIWFGRYLGCRVWSKTRKKEYTLNVIGLSRHKELDLVLILKELKDITDEDFKSLIAEVWDNIDYDTIQINRYDSHIEADMWTDTDEDYTDGCHQTNLYFGQDDYDFDVVDFLRSKGYAIGIPKEYYITESELS